MPAHDHVTVHRLYPAARNLLHLSDTEKIHIDSCRFCAELLDFFGAHAQPREEDGGDAREECA